jgi:hypothetical protein
VEHAVDLAYMAACGVDTNAVPFSQPDNGTDALNIVRKLVTSNTVDLIVVDSVAALTSAAELDADAGDQFIGVQARMMSQNLQAGGYFRYDDEMIGHGRENAKAFLSEHPKLFSELRSLGPGARGARG